MDKSSLRIVFMGTPEFAATSLQMLIKNGYHVVGVVTAPDKPAGRGMQLRQSAVKQLAIENNLPVLQPAKLKDPTFIEALQSLKPDLQVVVAFRMLPEVVWNMPPFGTINVHGSLLPDYRGAAPIHHAIMNGESETGVTTFKLRHAIDTGDILRSRKLSISPNETTGELHDRMMHAGAELLDETLTALLNNSLQPQPQHHIDEKLIKHAPKIQNADCLIHFNLPAQQVHNMIRGLSPFPGAYTKLGGKTLKIYKTQIGDCPSNTQSAGTIFTDGKSYFAIQCADTCLYISELQLEGKKKLKTEEFLRGYRLNDTSVG